MRRDDLSAMAAGFVTDIAEIETAFFDDAAGFGIVALSHAVADGPELTATDAGVLAYAGFVRDVAGSGEVRGEHGADLLRDCFERQESPEPLAGEFAAAHWSAIRGELTLATDPLGKWPLFYHQDEASGAIIFASELKSLLAHPQVERRLNRLNLGLYLFYRQIPTPFSGIEGVQRVHYGEVLRFDQRCEMSSEFSWNYLPVDKETRTLEEWDERVRDQYRAMFRRVLHGHDTVAIFLSAGLDSSLFYGLVKKDFPEIRCVPITAHYEAGRHKSPHQDLPFARKLAEHWGDPLVEVELSLRTIGPRLELLLRQDDQPFSRFGNNLSYDAMARAAAEHGASIALIGQGGGESLGLQPWVDVIAGQAEGRIRTFDDVREHFLERGTFSFSRLERLMGIEEDELRSDLLACYQPLADKLRSNDLYNQAMYGMLQTETREHVFHSTTAAMALSPVRLFNAYYDWTAYNFMEQVPSELKGSADPEMRKVLFHQRQQDLVPRWVYEREKRGIPAFVLTNGDLPRLEKRLLSREVVEAQGVFDPVYFQKLTAKRKLRHALLLAQVWLDVHVFQTCETFDLLKADLAAANVN